MRQHLKTGFLFLFRLTLNNQLKILIWKWNQMLNLVLHLLKVLYLQRKQSGVKLVNTFLCYFVIFSGFYFITTYSVFEKFSIFSKCNTSLCKYSFSGQRSLIKMLFTLTLGGSCKSVVVFCRSSFCGKRSSTYNLNNMSFGKTIETKFIFFYKLCCCRDTSILKTGTIQQSIIVFTKPTF